MTNQAEQLGLDLSNKEPFPDLTDKDMREFGKATVRIYNIMKDGRWYNATDIIEISGQREGLRRMRDLRSKWIIEKKIHPTIKREFQYRLKVDIFK